MAEHFHYEEEDIFNPETHHEESDVNVRALIWFFVIFVIAAVLIHFAVWFLYKQFASAERKGSERLTAIATPADASVPKNQPLLQPFPRKSDGKVLAPQRTTPVTDLSEMRREESEKLSSYGWVDQQHGVVRMPISVAKQLVVQRGLPLQQRAAPPATTTTAAPAAGAPAVQPATAPATPAVTATEPHR